MRYDINAPGAALDVDLVYHCADKRTVAVAMIDTVRKQYREASDDAGTIRTARQMIVADRVIYIDPRRAAPLPDVSALRKHRTLPPLGRRK